jgi:hypothetical protein
MHITYSLVTSYALLRRRKSENEKENSIRAPHVEVLLAVARGRRRSLGLEAR